MTASETRFHEDLRSGRYANGAVKPVTYACLKCRDAGFYRHDVMPGHPDFGRAVECSCGLVQRRRNERAAAKMAGAA